MASAQSRSNLESVISICILVVLLFVGTGVLLKQSNYDMGRFGISALQVLKGKDAIETPTFELSSVIPNGYEMTSQIETYYSDNLFEKINGKAPLYTESGFLKLTTQRFSDKQDQSLTAELYVYDMGSAKGAFCVYSVQKRAGTESLDDFTFAYKTENAVYLAHGRYYVELVGFSQSQRLFEAMTEILRKIEANLPVNNNSVIAELALFPQENIVDGSGKLYLTGAFGFEKLTDTFTARYQTDGETITTFINRCAGKNDAEKLAESYYNFLIDNGGVDKQSINKALKYKVVDFYGTYEIVSATGEFVFGVHEAENQQAAEKLAAKLAGAISKAEVVN